MKETYFGCRYCDGAYAVSTIDVPLCATCGAEWDPVLIEEEVPDRDLQCERCDKMFTREESSARAYYQFCSYTCEEREELVTDCAICGDIFDISGGGVVNYCPNCALDEEDDDADEEPFSFPSAGGAS